MPERPELALSPEERLLLECALPPESLQPEAIRSYACEVEDWNTFLQTALRMKLAPLAFGRLSEAGAIRTLPKPIMMRLLAAQTAAESENRRLLTERDRVLAAFENRTIPVLTLKGCALAEPLYRDVSLRPMGDLDLFVKGGDMHDVVALLGELGYSTDGIEARGETFFYQPEERRFIDVHSELDPSGRFRISTSELWTNSAPLPGVEDHASYPTLSAQHHLVHALLHGARHRLQSFGPLVDATWIAARWPDEVGWTSLPALAWRWRCREALGFALDAAHRLFRLPVPTEIQKELLPRGWRRHALQSIWPGQAPFIPVEARSPAVRYAFSALTTSWPGGFLGAMKRFGPTERVKGKSEQTSSGSGL